MSDVLDDLGVAAHKDELLRQQVAENRRRQISWASAWVNQGEIQTAYGHSRANVLADSPLADNPSTTCTTWRLQKGKWVLHDRYNCPDDTVVNRARDALSCGH